MNNSDPSYRPACQPESPLTCGECTLSYDCERKRNRGLAWPAVVLVVLLVAAIVL